MTKFQMTLLATAVLGLATAAQAQSNVKFNGDANIEFDNTYQNDETKDAPGVNADRGLSQGGRVELNVMGKSMNSDAFVAGRASFLAKKDGSVVTDDMWVQFGNKMGDLKLGRFEAADLYPVGRDTVLNRAGLGAYRGHMMRGRMGSDIFHAAGNLNLGGGLGLEVGLVETGDETKLGSNNWGGAAKGVRPVLTFAAGGFALKAGLEYGKTSGDDDLSGFALTGSTAVMGGSLNVNLASGKIKDVVKGTTIGANLTVPMGPWLLAEYATTKADGGGDKEKVTTLAAGYEFSLLGIKGASIIPAFSYSKAKDRLLPTATNEEEKALRVRIFYTFAAF